MTTLSLGVIDHAWANDPHDQSTHRAESASLRPFYAQIGRRSQNLRRCHVIWPNTVLTIVNLLLKYGYTTCFKDRKMPYTLKIGSHGWLESVRGVARVGLR